MSIILHPGPASATIPLVCKGIVALPELKESSGYANCWYWARRMEGYPEIPEHPKSIGKGGNKLANLQYQRAHMYTLRWTKKISMICSSRDTRTNKRPGVAIARVCAFTVCKSTCTA